MLLVYPQNYCIYISWNLLALYHICNWFKLLVNLWHRTYLMGIDLWTFRASYCSRYWLISSQYISILIIYVWMYTFIHNVFYTVTEPIWRQIISQASVYSLLQAASEIASRGDGRDRDINVFVQRRYCITCIPKIMTSCVELDYLEACHISFLASLSKLWFPLLPIPLIRMYVLNLGFNYESLPVYWIKDRSSFPHFDNIYIIWSLVQTVEIKQP